MCRLAVVLGVGVGMGGCGQPTPGPDVRQRHTAPAPREASPRSNPPRERIDVHVHHVADSVDNIVALMDEQGIDRAVILASPQLEHRRRSPEEVRPRGPTLEGWRETNDAVIAAAASEVANGRLIAFVTLDLADFDVAELDGWLRRGACGVKLYDGMAAMHRRPLTDLAYTPAFVELETRGLPLLLHVNSSRFGDELRALVERHPQLNLVCPHLCSSRTNLDNLEALMTAMPRLRVDLSHGPGAPGIAGFTNLGGEVQRERLRAMILAEPGRFLFGSDMVASHSATLNPHLGRQLRANLGLIEDERFEFWKSKRAGDGIGYAMGEYRGLALPEEVLRQVEGENARAWLGSCIDAGPGD